MARISIESGAPAAAPKGASKAAPSSSSSSSSGSSKAGKAPLDRSAKMKLIVAAVIFVLGVGAISWNLFLSDMLAPQKLTDKDVWQGGAPPTPEQEQQNQAVKKKVDEQIKGYEKKFGGGGS
jgi:hypothetical protein